MDAAGTARRGVEAEHVFYSTMALAILAAVVLGFTRTFLLKPLFPEVQHLAAPEPIFYVHGTVFLLWFVLLAAQPVFVARGDVRLHRRLGTFGAGLAAVVAVFG